MSTATLLLTPWARDALSDADTQRIAERAVDLHCRLSVMFSRKVWTIRIHSWDLDEHFDPVRKIERRVFRGNLADSVFDALDAYQRKYVFTPEELAQIQRQSAA